MGENEAEASRTLLGGRIEMMMKKTQVVSTRITPFMRSKLNDLVEFRGYPTTSEAAARYYLDPPLGGGSGRARGHQGGCGMTPVYHMYIYIRTF